MSSNIMMILIKWKQLVFFHNGKRKSRIGQTWRKVISLRDLP
jgi:hypothetical protein